MRKLDGSAPQAEAAGLVFPDWSGMDDSTARLSPEAAFQLCERYREWFPELATNRERQAAEKCAVEFVF